MRFHDPVDRVAMVNVVLGLETRDHRGNASESADQQEGKAHLPERYPPSGEGHKVEEDRRQQQCDWKVVQERVQAGPVVAEHGFSRSVSGERRAVSGRKRAKAAHCLRLLLTPSPKSAGTGGSTV
jgi:hypothetical protein